MILPVLRDSSLIPQAGFVRNDNVNYFNGEKGGEIRIANLPSFLHYPQIRSVIPSVSEESPTPFSITPKFGLSFRA